MSIQNPRATRIRAGIYADKELKFVKNNLSVIRTERGLSQGQLAKITGIPQTYIYKVEHHIANITAANLIVLARALNCGLADLLDVDLPEKRGDADDVMRRCYKQRLGIIQDVLYGKYDEK